MHLAAVTTNGCLSRAAPIRSFVWFRMVDHPSQEARVLSHHCALHLCPYTEKYLQ